jgi:hypothetical protein
MWLAGVASVTAGDRPRTAGGGTKELPEVRKKWISRDRNQAKPGARCESHATQPNNHTHTKPAYFFLCRTRTSKLTTPFWSRKATIETLRVMLYSTWMYCCDAPATLVV